MKKALFIFLFSIATIAYAQEKVTLSFNDISLSEAFTTIESEFGVKFSYNTKLTQDKSISIAEQSLSLAEIIQLFQKEFSVVFEKINERYYIIRDQNQEGKIRICGTLLDALSGIPIAQANIINSTQAKGVTSGKDGAFELFLVDAKDVIEIRYLGYKTQQFIASDLQKTPCTTINLVTDNVQLQEVTLGEYLTSGITKNKNGAIGITPKKLGILPGLTEPDVLQTIQLLPGIQSPSETASGLYIRGGTPDQNLILWDGIKMYHSGHFFGMLSAFNPYITEKVDLYRSGTEAKYGDRISGVIDITTDQDIPEKLEGGFGFNMTHADAYLKAPISDNFGVLVSVRRSFTDIFETITYDKFSERVFQNTRIVGEQQVFEDIFTETENKFYFTDFTVKAIGELSENDKLSISSLYTKNDLDYASGIPEFDQNNRDQLNITNFGLSAKWKHQWNAKLSHELSTYVSNFDLDYAGTANFDVLEETQTTERTIKKNSIDDIGIALDVQLQLSENQKLQAGYQFSSNDVAFTLQFDSEFDAEDNFREAVSEINNTHAVFGSYQYKTKKITLQGGIRANYFSSVSEVFFEPRLYSEIQLNKTVKAKFSAELKNQSISQLLEFDTTDFGLENQVWALADNDDIPVLQSQQLTAGILYQENGWKLDLEAYYKKVNGLTSLTRGFNNTDVTDEFSEGESDVLGLDILVQKKLKNHTSWISYAFTNNQFTFDELNNGNAFPGNFDIRHYLSIAHTYKYNNFQFSLGWNFRTGTPFTPASITGSGEEIALSFGENNSERLPSYHRLDFSGTYKFHFSKSKKWRGKIGISVLNIYNRENLLGREYEIRQFDDDDGVIQNQLQQIDRFSLGITPNLVFRVDF